MSEKELARRRRAKRAFVANYLRELSGRRRDKTATRKSELRTGNPVEQALGG